MKSHIGVRTVHGYMARVFVEDADRALETYARIRKEHSGCDGPEANVCLPNIGGTQVVVRVIELKKRKATHAYTEALINPRPVGLEEILRRWHEVEGRIVSPPGVPRGVYRRHIFPSLLGYPVLTSESVKPDTVEFMREEQCKGRLHRTDTTPRVECATCGNSFASRSASQPCGMRGCSLREPSLYDAVPPVCPVAQADGDPGIAEVQKEYDRKASLHALISGGRVLRTVKDWEQQGPLDIPFMHRWDNNPLQRCLKCDRTKLFAEHTICNPGKGSEEERLLHEEAPRLKLALDVPTLRKFCVPTPVGEETVEVRITVNITGRVTECLLEITKKDHLRQRFVGRSYRHPLDPNVTAIGVTLASTRALAEAASDGWIGAKQTAKALAEITAIVARQESK